VLDKTKVEARQLEASFHSLQTQNELLHAENELLQQALLAKKKHKKKSCNMDLQQRREYYGGATFWSPRKINEARAREKVKRNEAEAQQLQKTRDRELKAAASLYNKKQAEAVKAARREAAEQRAKEKKARAKELAAAWALKKLQREAATLQKSRDTPNKGKRKASQSASNKNLKRRRVVGAASQAGAAPEPPAPPPQRTRTRSIRRPKKYSE
jgi:hypothetical protein